MEEALVACSQLRIASAQRWGASLNKFPSLASEDFRISGLDHANARAAIVGDNVQRNFALDGAGNVGMAKSIKCPSFVEARIPEGQCHSPLLLRAIPACSIAAPEEGLVFGSIFADQGKEPHGFGLRIPGMVIGQSSRW
jgi:hypothetical protein